MSENKASQKFQRVSELIADFCKLILTKEDHLNNRYNKALEYINNLKTDDMSLLFLYSEEKYKRQINYIVQAEISVYISYYKDYTESSPFDFDQGINLQEYSNFFMKKYSEKFDDAPPNIYQYAFEYIQNASDSYRLFEKFYSIRKDKIDQSLADTVFKGLEEVERKAQTVAQTAANREKAKVIKSINYNVKNKMEKMNAKLTETSVTILGIFSGIVLTFVAGLFYSSSVLESISKASFLELICIASLVGLVCIQLLAIMFYFIIKIKDTKNKPKISFLLIIIDGILAIIMILSGIAYLNDSNVTDVKEDNKYNVSMDISFDETESSNTSTDINN